MTRCGIAGAEVGSAFTEWPCSSAELCWPQHRRGTLGAFWEFLVALGLDYAGGQSHPCIFPKYIYLLFPWFRDAEKESTREMTEVSAFLPCGKTLGYGSFPQIGAFLLLLMV